MIKENLDAIRKTIPEHVTLVAVSKTKPVAALQEVYDAGQRHFGENKVQEMTEKWEVLPKDIKWHLIGHLQTNKVKYIAPYVHLIHSVDSFKLLKEIDKEAKKNNRIIDCLLQFHVAQEDTKFGLDFEEAKELIENPEFIDLHNVHLVGVMGMASFTENEDVVRKEFQQLEDYFQLIKSYYFTFNDDFKEISMGMSGDYQLAIEEGSTMVRVGSSIFGTR
ncbi:MAG: YggS family pyridoxal phosphate-dependent enzyme [Fluviicola sp.]|jgi:pyridoxal phosphate enzyme (YggS family)|nr:YggS family pyridoxal phosphate-dependent enzyme [Fluviicola sp.]